MVKVDLDKLKQVKLNQLKFYVASLLAPTDYITIKISEAQALGNADQVNELKQTYASQLQQRLNIRAWNEQMKQAIQNAKTIEELEAIKIEFEG